MHRRSFIEGSLVGGLSLLAAPACSRMHKPLPAGPVPDPLAPRAVFSKHLDAAAFVRRLTDRQALQLISAEPINIRGLLRELDYNRSPIVAGELTALGNPGIRFTDGPRGVVMYNATCFPVAMARGAAFDPALETEVGEAIGKEARALGANLWAGACVNLLRHPGWGRAQETYGEDPHHVGVLGAAVIHGVQRHVMACVKHFACNSIENSRFRLDVQVDDRALREVYLVAFRHAVDAGVAAVMSAYNKVNGVYCGQNRGLLTDILRGEMGFDGFVMSDFLLGIRDGVEATQAGLDLEMPFAWRAGVHLGGRLVSGDIRRDTVDLAATRVLRQQVRFASTSDMSYPREVVASPEHRALARRVAVEGMVLLKNEGAVLPLNPDVHKKVALVGRLGNAWNIGDEGSSMVRPPHVVTLSEGLRHALGEHRVLFDGSGNADRSAKLAATADAAIVTVGFTHADEGENLIVKGGDRRTLRLRLEDETLIFAVALAQPKTVVLMIGGSAIVTEGWREQAPAILMAWYPGMEGGHAVADVLFGVEEPGGRLPCVFPRDESHLPHFDPDADSAVYDLFHGYRKLDADGREPAFAFGHGLGYTKFALREVGVSAGDPVVVRVTLSNVGDRPGSEVVQVYVGKPASVYPRAPRELKAFRKVRLAPGASSTVELAVPLRDLAVWDRTRGGWYLEPGEYQVWVGRSSHHQALGDPATITL